jgi:NADPH:quinone reductase-like Zn-dependent oxidoreductase
MDVVPRTMRAVLLTGHGGFDRLQYRSDAPVPHPGAGDVLIRLRAAAVNNTDINLRSGWYSKAAPAGNTDGVDAATAAADAGWDGAAVRFPLIQGADGCGEVVAVGPGADPGLIGKRVVIDPIVRRVDDSTVRHDYLGTDRDGCFAEYVAVPAINAIAVHSSLSDAELASFPCSYLAAENMLARAAIGPRDEVLITGASGGVGSAAVQLARRRGARITALAASDKASAIEALGAQRVLPRDADLVATLGACTMDAVIDCVGGAQFAGSMQVLRPRGRYAVAGAIAGPRVELDLRTLYLKDLSLFGCTIAAPGTFRDLVGYVERGEIKPLLAQTYSLQNIADAQRMFLSKQHVGKIVIEI